MKPFVSRVWIALFLLVIGIAGPALAQDDAPASEPTDTASAAERVNAFLEPFNDWWATTINTRLANVLFAPVYSTDGTFVDGNTVSLPLIVVVLLAGGVFFTLRYGFVNIRMFRHAIDVIRGRYDRPEDQGEVSHFQALTSALSATVGLGNIAGVAVAITLGGPGAIFWMWLTAIFGMSMKFSSCTLAHVYRRVAEDGRVLGGPMVYLDEGLKELHPALAPLGKFFAVLYAVFLVLAAFAAGNMFQANQTANLIDTSFFGGSESLVVKLFIGIALALLAGIVIIGGIRRIGEITSRLVPLMCGFYIAVCLLLIALNLGEVPELITGIFAGAFNAEALYGGFLGVLVQGARRAAFSNEAGLGSAAVAHAAARTAEPVREGMVAMIGPFIDTIIVCTMTALAILITGAHKNPTAEGVEITAAAFAQLGAFAPIILTIAVFVFAYSTMIAWGYYGERGTEYLFGPRAVTPYRVLYVLTIIVGPLLKLGAVIDFADMLLLSLAFPNIIGMALIAGKVKGMTDDYIGRLKNGTMQPER